MCLFWKSCAVLIVLYIHNSNISLTDCTKAKLLEMIKNRSGFLTSQLEESYPDGDQWVEVPCDTGYEGYFRGKCNRGQWEHEGSSTGCTRKSVSFLHSYYILYRLQNRVVILKVMFYVKKGGRPERDFLCKGWSS